MQKTETEIFYPRNVVEWRAWLKKNHARKQAVWLVFYKKSSETPSLTWSESVDEALCFGWIDSKKVAIDHERSHQFFSKRKAKSTWSKINKAKIERLTSERRMTKAGFDSIEIAKKNGSWTILDEVEELILPQDLEQELKAKGGAYDYFISCSKSAKKGMLYWVMSGKRPETRQKRIDEIVELAAEEKKPKQF